MTNFQGAPPSRLSREQVLVGAPALLGGLAALAFAALGLVPLWQGLQAEQQRWQGLQADRERLPLLRRQLVNLEQRRQRAEAHNRRIIGLVAGSGDLTTLLALLSTEAAAAGVVLDRYEPVTPPSASGTDAKAAPKAVKPAADPLLLPGFTKSTLLLTARGGGVQLVDFLRRLERLSPLVVQSNLAVKAGSPAELRLTLSLYGDRSAP